MTDQQHPIKLLPGLVQQWCRNWTHADGEFIVYLATQAARWGADQELEACCKWLTDQCLHLDGLYLRDVRRPPAPPETVEIDGHTYRLVK